MSIITMEKFYCICKAEKLLEREALVHEGTSTTASTAEPARVQLHPWLHTQS